MDSVIVGPVDQPFTFNIFKEEFGTENVTFSIDVPNDKRLVVEQVSVEEKMYNIASNPGMTTVVTTQTLNKYSKYNIVGTCALSFPKR